MARLFDDASSEYLLATSTPITAAPLTMACWFYSDDITIRQAVMQIFDASKNSHYFQLDLRGDVAGDPVRFTIAAGSTSSATTTTGYSANTWHHACGVEVSTTDHRCLIDGGSVGTDTNAREPSGLDQTSIGMDRDTSASYPTSGRIAEAAFWDVALSDAQVALLALGYSPLFFQPENLVSYSRLIRDEDFDEMGGVSWSAFNTPSVAEHMPKIIYPAAPFISFPSAAVAANAPTADIQGPLYGPLGGPIAA